MVQDGAGGPCKHHDPKGRNGSSELPAHCCPQRQSQQRQRGQADGVPCATQPCHGDTHLWVLRTAGLTQIHVKRTSPSRGLALTHVLLNPSVISAGSDPAPSSAASDSAELEGVWQGTSSCRVHLHLPGRALPAQARCELIPPPPPRAPQPCAALALPTLRALAQPPAPAHPACPRPPWEGLSPSPLPSPTCHGASRDVPRLPPNPATGAWGCAGTGSPVHTSNKLLLNN